MLPTTTVGQSTARCETAPKQYARAYPARLLLGSSGVAGKARACGAGPGSSTVHTGQAQARGHSPDSYPKRFTGFTMSA